MNSISKFFIESTNDANNIFTTYIVSVASLVLMRGQPSSCRPSLSTLVSYNKLIGYRKNTITNLENVTVSVTRTLKHVSYPVGRNSKKQQQNIDRPMPIYFILHCVDMVLQTSHQTSSKGFTTRTHSAF